MTGFRCILGATDFSQRAARAVARAARLAAEHGSKLELLHVVNRRPLQDLAHFLPGLKIRSESEMVSAAQAELHRLAQSLGRQRGIGVSTRVRIGSPAREIVGHAAALEADIAVLGAHGEHFIKGVLTGATTQKVARAADCPVLIVRREARRSYENALVPVDLSSKSSAALEMAVRAAPGASLYVLHAYEPLFEDKAYFADASKEALAHYRKSIEEGIRRDIDALIGRVDLGDAVVTRLVRRGHAPRVIVRAAEELDVDLIVMNARERTELSRFFLGSVSLHTLLEAHTDVLLVR